MNSFFSFYVIVGKIFGLKNFNSIEVCMGSVIVIFFFSRISATGAVWWNTKSPAIPPPPVYRPSLTRSEKGRVDQENRGRVV